MTATIDIDIAVYNEVYRPYLDATHRTQIFFGGSASGKSVFLAQRCIEDLLKGGRNYLICRAVQRTIRRSVYNELLKIIRAWGVTELFTVNKSEMIITCANGYQILFSGLDDVEKVKSITPERGVITDIWIEEATETSQDSVRQLYKRQRGESDKPKRMTMSFNPIMMSHWIYQEYFQNWNDDTVVKDTDDLLILKTTHVDNEFLADADRADLENETDEYFYNVYTRGLWGVLGDVIFKNWRVEDLSDRQLDSTHNGLDFGFASDPAAFVRSCYRGDTIYIMDEFVERGLTNDILADEVKKMLGREYIKCDSAEPKSIAELRQYGINAMSSTKGKDSVVHGIQWLQQKEIVIDAKCVNTIQEFQQYQWKKDKDGNSIRQPIDKNNHTIDAIRYAYCDEWHGNNNLSPKATTANYIMGRPDNKDDRRPGF